MDPAADHCPSYGGDVRIREAVGGTPASSWRGVQEQPGMVAQ